MNPTFRKQTREFALQIIIVQQSVFVSQLFAEFFCSYSIWFELALV